MAKKKRFPEPTYMTIEEVRNYAKHNLYSDWGPVGPTLAAIVLELLPEDDGGYGDGKPCEHSDSPSRRAHEDVERVHGRTPHASGT
jgi:hypothetical protein